MGYPTNEICQQQLTSYHAMSNDVLLLLAATGDHGACSERLVREVMKCDSLSWPAASDKVNEMARKAVSGERVALWLGVYGAAALALSAVYS